MGHASSTAGPSGGSLPSPASPTSLVLGDETAALDGYAAVREPVGWLGEDRVNAPRWHVVHQLRAIRQVDHGPQLAVAFEVPQLHASLLGRSQDGLYRLKPSGALFPADGETAGGKARDDEQDEVHDERQDADVRVRGRAGQEREELVDGGPLDGHVGDAQNARDAGWPTRTAGESGFLPPRLPSRFPAASSRTEKPTSCMKGALILGGLTFLGEGERGYAARFTFAYLAEVEDPAPQPLAVYHAFLPWFWRAHKGRASSSAPSRRSGVRPCAVMPSRPVTVPAASSAFKIASSVASAAA